MAGKSLGKTVLGWFVVQEEDGEPVAVPTADELLAKYGESSAAPLPPPVELKGDLPRAMPAGGTIDFAAVYRAAAIGNEEQGRVEKASALLKTLPAETPKEVKRQIVEASLQAFGFPVDQIIEAGAQQIQALQAYIQHGERETQNVLQQGNTRLAELQAQMAEVRRVMEDQVASQQALAKASNEEKLRVQVVLEFFGQEAVARVVKESPKLVEPSA